MTFELHCSVPWMKIWGVAPSRRSGTAPAVPRCLFRDFVEHHAMLLQVFEIVGSDIPRMDPYVQMDGWSRWNQAPFFPKLVHFRTRSETRSNGTLESTKEMPLDGRRIAQARGCQSNKHRSIGKLAAAPKNNHLQKVARCCQQRV